MRIRRYLLGELDDGAQQELEQELLTNAELFNELLMLEDELIDEYLAGRLTAAEDRRFQAHFLVTNERREKLNFARALNRYISAQEPVPLPERHKASTASTPWVRTFFSSRLRFAVYAMVLIAIGLAVWSLFFRQSEVDKGLLALNAAYREGRPIEARISDLNYAPYSSTRGPGTERVDQNELARAELTLLDSLKRNPTPDVHHALGEVYLAKKQFDDAIKQFDEALKGQPNSAQFYSDLGAAWLERGRLDRDTDPGTGMEELGRSQENLTKALQLNPNALEALFNRALTRESLKLYPQAEEDWREYLRKDPNSQWTEEAQKHLKEIEKRKVGNSRNKEQLRQDFLVAYERRDGAAAWTALSRSRSRAGNSIVEFLIEDLLTSGNEGRSTNTEEALARLLYAGKVETESVGDRFTADLAAFYRIANDRARTAAVRARETMRLGMQRYDRGEWQKASELFSQAAEIFSQGGDYGEKLFAEAWVGYCYLRIPDAARAGGVFLRLAHSFEQHKYKSLLAQSLLAQADVLNSQNEFSGVLEKANQSRILSEQLADYANAVRSLQAGTSMQLMFGNYRESLESTYRALTLADSLPRDPKVVWPFYHEAAMTFHFLGLATTAFQFEKEALRIALDAGLRFHASRSYDRLSVLSAQNHNFADAVKYSEQAQNEGKKIDDEKTRTNVLAHTALALGDSLREFGDFNQAIALYDEALQRYATLNLDIYKYRAHKGKLLSFIALNDNGSAESELNSALYWFEQDRRKIAEESYRNKFFDAGQSTYDIAIDFAYSRKADAAKAFDYAETSRARSLLDLIATGARVSHDSSVPELELSSVASPLTLSQVQAQMPSQTQLLEYAVLDEKVIAWVITRDGLRTASVALNRADLDRKVANYVDALLQRTPAAGTVVEAAKDLYACLVSPIEPFLRRDLQITVVPTDNLNFVPFAALINPESGRYLVEDYTLAVSPSATVFIHASKEALAKGQVAPERLVVVGNPSFDHQRFKLPDLPAAAREARGIASAYGGNPLIGPDATPLRVKQGLKENEIAHFATHAVSDEQSPLLSKLVLAKDRAESHHSSSAGYLQASEIYELKLPRTRLVVLSACQTGIERSYRGEGAIGLARPFLAVGVPLVVASLWPVESATTADLMISFHEHRRQNHMSTAEALRQAQLDAIQQQRSGSSNRYEWAAFVVIGGYADF